MKVDDLYRNVVNKYGKGKIWSMNVDEFCDLLEENFDIYEKDEVKK